MDLINLLLLAWSTGTLCLTCWRLEKVLAGAPLLSDELEIKRDYAYAAPLVASVVLLLSYFVGSLMFAMLILMTCNLAVYTVPFVVDPLLSQLKGRVLAVALLAVWLYTGHWIPHDLLTTSIVVTGLCLVRAPSAKVYTALLCGLMLYDVFWVFFSHRIFKEGVMDSVATTHYGSLWTPGTFIYPISTGNYQLLGLGDVVFPGIVVTTLFRFGRDRLDCSHTWDYAAVTIVGYVLGMLLCTMVLDYSQHSQPALLYLTPFTVLPGLLLAHSRGVFDPLWNGWEGQGYQPIV